MSPGVAQTYYNFKMVAISMTSLPQSLSCFKVYIKLFSTKEPKSKIRDIVGNNYYKKEGYKLQ